jgi:hypothetical protein
MFKNFIFPSWIEKIMLLQDLEQKGFSPSTIRM